MAGTREGGRKAAVANLAKDPDFYSKIGKKGGAVSTQGGFASPLVGDDGLTGPQRASVVGAWGGRKSRRKPRSIAEMNEIKAPVKQTFIQRFFGHNR